VVVTLFERIMNNDTIRVMVTKLNILMEQSISKTEAANHITQITETQLLEVTSDIDCGMFDDTTEGVKVDGGSFL